MMCKQCKSTSIKTRKNYSHGKKSKPIMAMTCKRCGSPDIDKDSEQNNRRRRRR